MANIQLRNREVMPRVGCEMRMIHFRMFQLISEETKYSVGRLPKVEKHFRYRFSNALQLVRDSLVV
jgi:hypothetical protein